MTRTLLSLSARWVQMTLTAVVFAACAAVPAVAQNGPCYADYKARRDQPYDLHYGVMQVRSCDRGGAEAEVRQRLARSGWQLLSLVSVFGPDQLEGKKANAGPYYLRF